jgi:hypothetical protein
MTIEYHSYLIRIWRETSTDLHQLGDWHGEVEQIQNGSSWTIQSVEHLLDLIHAQEHEIHPIQCQKIED